MGLSQRQRNLNDKYIKTRIHSFLLDRNILFFKQGIGARGQAAAAKNASANAATTSAAKSHKKEKTLF